MKLETLIQPLIERAQTTPEHAALVFIAEDGVETKITSGELHHSAEQYARVLKEMGIGPDDLVILVLRHSEILLSAFWGALYLGAIPSIFPFLTEKLDPVLYRERVKTLVAHSGARAVITMPEFESQFSALLADVGCKVVSTDQVSDRNYTADFNPWSGNPDKIAFLQHSSGTTGLQKGVALSHRAVLNQIKAYSAAIDLRPDDVVVSWLPLYHDMGLIAGFVIPIVTGTPLVLMSPFHWIRDPKILLWAIHNHRGTLAWLPNFAYNHLARSARPSYLEGLDLSSWRMAINCSEPVYHHSHQVFLEKFTFYGFSPAALAVSYAMAENTFAVTQTASQNPPELDWVNIATLQEQRQAIEAEPKSEGAAAVVSCGAPIVGTQIRIVDEARQILVEREVGEIAIQSDCMLSEYHQRPELTAEVIVDGWYYTGDMGYLAGGELYVTGRKKDLIIVGGKNVYPQDLEAIANRIPGIYPGRAVAFGLFDERMGSENIVIVAELNDDQRDPAEVERELRAQIVRETEVTLADVRFVDQRWVLKTSSGKLARGDNREKYMKLFRP
jgi:acyl-CoA synthetase (AMP-forming)/AMP-acid ligase II